MSERQEKVSEVVRRSAAMFIERESNHDSLISVTHVDVSPDMKNAKIFISVMPDTKAAGVVDFLTRKMKDFRQEFKKESRTNAIPFFTIEEDRGEKHRQHIEDLSRQL